MASYSLYRLGFGPNQQYQYNITEQKTIAYKESANKIGTLIFTVSNLSVSIGYKKSAFLSKLSNDPLGALVCWNDEFF